MIIGDV